MSSAPNNWWKWGLRARIVVSTGAVFGIMLAAGYNLLICDWIAEKME